MAAVYHTPSWQDSIDVRTREHIWVTPLVATPFRKGAGANRALFARPDGPDHVRGTEIENLRRNTKSDRVGRAIFLTTLAPKLLHRVNAG